MTELEWLTCEVPKAILAFARGKTSDRKCLLYSVACSRRGWELIGDCERRWAHLAERYADGELTLEDLRSAGGGHIVGEGILSNDDILTAVGGVANNVALDIAYDRAADHLNASGNVIDEASERDLDELDTAASREFRVESIVQCQLLRDIFGNPFRLANFSSEWRTGITLSLARQMYERREFFSLPILADALQDAGCGSADLLDHCRSGGLHVRGCWVVDLVLEKE